MEEHLVFKSQVEYLLLNIETHYSSLSASKQAPKWVARFGFNINADDKGRLVVSKASESVEELVKGRTRQLSPPSGALYDGSGRPTWTAARSARVDLAEPLSATSGDMRGAGRSSCWFRSLPLASVGLASI